MLQLQENYYFIMSSNVSCLPPSLLTVQSMTSSLRDERHWDFIFDLKHSKTHTLCFAHTMNSPLMHADTQTHTHHRSSKYIHTRPSLSEWQMKEVNCLSLASWVAAGGYECTVIWKERKWICWVSLFVSEAISFFLFAHLRSCHISLICKHLC